MDVRRGTERDKEVLRERRMRGGRAREAERDQTKSVELCGAICLVNHVSFTGEPTAADGDESARKHFSLHRSVFVSQHVTRFVQHKTHNQARGTH